ncbi:hypothetical protein HK101_007932 [Irineochytrium annulatum]|nr:hypothetical protein HK101_007932 [Irineochytrium annulatum]
MTRAQSQVHPSPRYDSSATVIDVDPPASPASSDQPLNSPSSPGAQSPDEKRHYKFLKERKKDLQQQEEIDDIKKDKMANPKLDSIFQQLAYKHRKQDPLGIYVPTDDVSRLVDVSFNVKELSHEYKPQWRSKMKRSIYEEKLVQRASIDYDACVDNIELLKLRTLTLPKDLQSGEAEMDILAMNRFYKFSEDEKLEGGDVWYVNFSDQHLFGEYQTDYFASNEIMVMQHPILGSIREAMVDFQHYGLFQQTLYQQLLKRPGLHRHRILCVNDRIRTGTGWKNSLNYGYRHFYVPKDKTKDVPTLRTKEFQPVIVDAAGRPTPVIIMNIPRLTDKYDIYGEKFICADEETIKRAVEVIPPAITPLPTTNVINMAAIDKYANPLRPISGPYRIHHVHLLFTTAYTAFRGAVRKSRQAAGGMSGRVDVCIHTGFWGCGEFGGNPVVMAFLQMAAARAVGVRRLVFHYKVDGDHVDRKPELVRGGGERDQEEEDADAAMAAKVAEDVERALDEADVTEDRGAVMRDATAKAEKEAIMAKYAPVKDPMVNLMKARWLMKEVWPEQPRKKVFLSKLMARVLEVGLEWSKDEVEKEAEEKAAREAEEKATRQEKDVEDQQDEDMGDLR